MLNQHPKQGILDSAEFEEKMSDAALLARLQEKSREKSYQEENRWWYSLTNITSYLCQLINVFSGFAKPYAYLMGIFSFGFVGDILAVAIAAFIVVAIEFAGRKNMEQFFEKKFFKGRVMNGRIFAQVMLMSGIVSLSYWGAPDAARIMSGEVTEPTALLLNESDVRAHYDPIIAAAEKQEKEFFAASSWAGKLSPVNQRRYNDKQNATSALRAEMSAKIAEVGKMNREMSAAAKQKFEELKAKKDADDTKNGSIFAFIAVMSCLLFLVTVWLKEKYEYLSAVELLKAGALKNEGMTARLKHTLKTISSDAIRAEVAESSLPKDETRRPIGFVRTEKTPTTPTQDLSVSQSAQPVSQPPQQNLTVLGSDQILLQLRTKLQADVPNFAKRNGIPATISGRINKAFDECFEMILHPDFSPSRSTAAKVYQYLVEEAIPALNGVGYPYEQDQAFLKRLLETIPKEH